MALIKCPECQAEVSDEAVACPKCGHPIARENAGEPEEEAVLFEGSPEMFRNRPCSFVLCCVLSLVGVGLIIFLVWWLNCRNTRLQVTNRRTTLRTGILSKNTIELTHKNIRSVVVRQTFFQRMMGVGRIELSSAAESDFEIAISGLRDPESVAAIIKKYQE